MIDAVGLKDFDRDDGSSTLFEQIAINIVEHGYSIVPNALPELLAINLWQHLQTMPKEKFDAAGVGREQDNQLNRFVRTDEICWINGESEAGKQWLHWAENFQQYLNRRLFLCLFSFESHFAHYRPGDFYKKHLDAFKGETNRVLSLVYYLNPGWLPEDGGELKLYLTEDEKMTMNVTPAFGTLAVFLSEDFPHEVLPTKRDRYSIAGWFRVNTSSKDKVDPPR
jgi:SM-20-related protein